MKRFILSLVFLALASSVGLAADTYEIQAAGNDEIFVIKKFAKFGANDNWTTRARPNGPPGIPAQVSQQ